LEGNQSIGGDLVQHQELIRRTNMGRFMRINVQHPENITAVLYEELSELQEITLAMLTIFLT
ncbi:Hypothetical predicted protein, partial [Xyrichtys novacula]